MYKWYLAQASRCRTSLSGNETAVKGPDQWPDSN